MKTYILFAALLFTVAANAQTSYVDRYAASIDPVFRGRVRFAMLESASNILADTTTSARRLYSFAGRIMLEPSSESFVSMFTNAVLTNPVINSGSTDSDIAFTVNTQFAKLGKAYRRERGELSNSEKEAEVVPSVSRQNKN